MDSVRPERYYPWLAIAAFLAPLLGGQLSLDPQALAPSGLLVAIFREPQGAVLGHFLILLPLVIGVLVALFRRAVLQVPHPRTVAAWVMFAVLLLASVAMSAYKFMSLQTLLEWWAYLVAFFAAVALSGRGVGPRFVVGAFAGGATLVALMAIREYAQQEDPTWRVFANWHNPNALAALLVMGTFACLACIARNERNRLSMVAPALGATLCSVGMMLTGSKGGLVALAVGGMTFLLMSLPRGAKPMGRALLLLGGTVACGAILANLIVASHRKPSSTAPSGGAFSRISNAGANQEQSSGFRKLLWQTSVDLIKDNPMGRGLGTFRYHSAKPGLGTQTQLAHQSFLQLGVEAGVAGLAVFIFALGLSLFEVLRGSRGLPEESALLRTGVLSALVGLVAHAVVDSDFSYFGLGFAFFLMLGTLFQLASDATVPEFTPRGLRVLAGTMAALVAVGMLYFGVVDVKLGTLRYALGASDARAAHEALDSVRSFAPGDPRVWALGARMAKDSEERKEYLNKVVALGPTPVAHRQLADVFLENNDDVGAERELNASLTLDPNNLFTLKRLLELAKRQDPDKAERVARRLVEIESKPYFSVRSIPELVPTETYEARAFLAESLTGTAKAEMLKPAIEGYLQYARTTLPPVKTFAKGNMDGDFGGVTLAQAQEKVTVGVALCDLVATADPKQAAWANESKKVLEAGLSSLAD